ncbi:MAG: methyltransferase [Candidatus Promineifilaceae bacterium]|jgi:16S rRNA (guanine1207-N2)-methyltransferase
MDLVEDCASRDFLQALTAEKQLTFPYRRQHLRFQVSQELFSSYQVDTGTQLLLKTASELAASEQVNKVLDLGCGYGPLGLAFAAAREQRQVHLVDRDALAVQFTQTNARLNKLNNILTYGSLGYDDVNDNNFDLLLSNIPGKAGLPAIESMLLDARQILNPQGIAAVVVVSPLADPVTEILTRPDVEILLREEGSEHVVFHYRFLGTANPPSLDSGKNGENHNQTILVFAPRAFDRGFYDRGSMDVDYRGLKFNMQTVRGLPEFDKISHQTELLFSTLEKVRSGKKSVQHVLIFNPRQGHVPVGIHKQLNPRFITLIDRDLLALRSSKRNLLANGRSQENLSLRHQVNLEADGLPAPDLILGVLRDSEGPAANYEYIRQAAGLLAPKGQLTISASSTTITRLEKTIKQNKLMTVKQRKRNRAKRLLILETR